MRQLHSLAERLDELSEKETAEGIYAAAHDAEIEPKDLFAAAYRVLIGKEKGPRLAGFLKTCGKDKVIGILKRCL